MTTETPGPPPGDFHLERYKYILQQLHATNENAYRFLAIYQTLATTLAGAALALFVGYRKWEIEPGTAQAGVLGILCLITLVALFTTLFIVVGIFSWLDYRREECELTDEAVRPGFRKPPRHMNFLRWYETYIIAFILISMALLWSLTLIFIVPAIR
ncbi:hypothetical protein [Plantactinospora sp. CA-290183]|uniref:hypothetical protein n=1 Tax=Plantactinospora sp. CA-290183 TaxID=3240006 RepID=UPI003D934816